MSASEDELIRRIQSDMLDSYDEELEMELDDQHLERQAGAAAPDADARAARRLYFRELFRMQGELVKLQDLSLIHI